MVPDRLQLQRLELKYIIQEELTHEVRNFVGAYLEIDEYGATRENLSYPVHSLYLDSDDLKIYWGTINGNKNRYKLRLRFYENQPDAPVYFEIKRRMNDAILKQRGAVRRDAVPLILAGQHPEANMMISPDPKHLVAVQRFCELMLENRAHPKAHVAYYREAYISPLNNSVRITMDRDVRCCPEPTARLVTEMDNPVYPFGKNNVVLELKFTGRFPDWFRELVHSFGLVQCSAAKYVDGVAVAGENRFAPLGYSILGASQWLENAASRKINLEKLQIGEKLEKI
jgi:SPX domain protein involved in polyphosphate accumulation